MLHYFKVFKGLTTLALTILLLLAQSTRAQVIESKDWYQKDLKTDSFYGISLDQAYRFLQGKKSVPVVVAVIDAGIDTTHEDLKNIIWTNPREIAGNKKDDDGNGYIDDIHGWNFLGNADGKNLAKDVEEKARVYYFYKNKFNNAQLDTATLSKWEKYQYHTWERAAQEFNDPQKIAENNMAVTYLQATQKALLRADSVLQQEMGKKEYTFGELEKFTPATDNGKRAKMAMLAILRIASVSSTDNNTGILSSLKQELDKYENDQKAREQAPEPYRAEIIKDNYNDFHDRYYGNNDVYASDPMHGTHVSGIIAAERNNGIGINGIADNVKIMPVRAVPDGDEYDKDIALAIRYAVDNGARVINMSFGKAYSPQKYWVDSAVAYAQDHDVLLVNAAGNESQNVDSEPTYPNQDLLAFGTHAQNMITVGASGDPRIGDQQLAAQFSNYGKNTVDVFAPGERIYSTLPKGNNYSYEDGTSMAAPVVTGIAALIRSYFPKLSAEQVKYAITHSAVKTDLPTLIPGSRDQKATLADLSITGGIANAYEAVKLAATLTPEKPQRVVPAGPAKRSIKRK